MKSFQLQGACPDPPPVVLPQSPVIGWRSTRSHGPPLANPGSAPDRHDPKNCVSKPKCICSLSSVFCDLVAPPEDVSCVPCLYLSLVVFFNLSLVKVRKQTTELFTDC